MKMKKVISILLCICLIASLAALAGCGNQNQNPAPNQGQSPDPQAGANNTLPDFSDVAKDNEANAGDPVYGGNLRLGFSGGSISNPGYTPINSAAASVPYMRASYESLLVFDEAGNLIPQLCESYEADPEEPSITWTLKQGIKFTDGADFNAEAVKRNIEEYALNNRAEVARIEKCDIIDEYTIKTVLTNWDFSAVESIGYYVLFMSPAALENVDALSNSTCGTGPFQLSDFSANVYAIYTKNENYWQEGKPYLDKVSMYNVDEVTTQKTAFLAGEYDIIVNSDAVIANELLTAYADKFADGTYIHVVNSNGVGVTSAGIIPYSADPNSPWADARVRLAMAYAIDTQAIADAFTYGLAIPTDQWAVPGSKTYNNDMKTVSYDPEKARELLADAGYADGFDTVLNVNKSVDMYTAIAAMLTEVGIRTEVNQIDASTWFSYMFGGVWEGLIPHAATVTPDLGLYMGRHLSENAAFYRHGIVEDQQTQDLLNAICASKDINERNDLEMQLQEAIYNGDDGVMLFGTVLYVQPMCTFKVGTVHGDNFSVCVDGAILTFADAWIEG